MFKTKSPRPFSTQTLVIISLFVCSALANGQDGESTQAQAARNADGVLQLEAVIRSSKEQPRVMSIVPWHLPSHKSIGENQAWRLQTSQLKPIERSQFRRELALRQQLWPQSAAVNQAKTNPDASGEVHKEE